MSDFYEKYQRERDERAALVRAKVMPALAAAGVVAIAFDYDGQGDSGQMEQGAVLDAEGNDTGESVVALAERLGLTDPTDNRGETLIDALAWQALEVKFAGWEINEGAFGIVRILPDEDRVVVEHNHRIETSESDTQEF